MDTMCSLVPESIGKEFKELFEEYTLQETSEAQFVKDLDRLEMIIQAAEYEDGNGKNMVHYIGLFFSYNLWK